MGQIVPVNGFARATEIGRCGYTHAAFDKSILCRPIATIHRAFSIERCSLEPVPTRAFHDGIQALAESATGDAQAMDRARIWLNQVTASQYYRAHAETM